MARMNSTENKNNHYPINPPPLPPFQAAIHCIVLILGWGIYFWFVWRVLTYSDTTEFYFIGTFLLGCFIVAPLITYSWIVHNINIFKNKQPRVASPHPAEKYAVDCFGTPVTADWNNLKKSSKIIIDITKQGKFYYSVDHFKDLKEITNHIPQS